MADSPIEHHLDLPDGALPVSVVEVVEYLTEDGQRQYGYRHGGSGSLAVTVGLLRLAEKRLIESADF